MSRIATIAAEVIAGVALVATGAGAIAFGTIAAVSVAGVSTTAMFAASAALTAVAAITAKKPAATGGSPTAWKADPQAGIPYAMGECYNAGDIRYRMAYGKDNKYQTLVTALSGGGPHQGPFQLYVDNVARGFTPGGAIDIPDQGFAFANTQLGHQPEASNLLCGPIAPYQWTADCKLSGYAATIVTLKYDTKGKHTLTTTPAIGWYGKWARVYDPRKDSTYPGGNGAHRWNDESTWEYSANPYLNALTWLIGRRHNGKLVLGMGVPLSGNYIIVSQFVDGANIADANKWTCGGVVYSTDKKWEVLKKILVAGSGQPLKLNAQLGVLVDAPKVSLATVSFADLAGKISVQTTQPRKDRINAVVPRYMGRQDVVTQDSDGNLLTSTTFDMLAGSPVIVDQYVAFDGKLRQRQADFPMVSDLTQSQQLARYTIENAREFGPITLRLKLRWLGYRPGDVITLNLPEDGLNGQDVLILQRSLDPSGATVTLTCRTETAGKHAFALGQTGVAPATPSVTGPALVPVPGASAWSLTGGAVASANGTTAPALIVTGAVDSDVIDAIMFRYRTSQTQANAAGAWIDVGAQAPAIGLLNITGVQDQTSYDVAIAYRKGPATGDPLILGPAVAGQTAVPWQAGVVGPGKPQDSATVGAPAGTYVAGVLAEQLTEQVQALQASTSTDTTPPAVPTGLTATSTIVADGSVDLAFSWIAPGDSDLASYVLQVALNGGGSVRFAAPGNSYVLHGLQPNTPFSAQVEALDRSGNPSGFGPPYSSTTTKDTTPPAAPTNLTFSAGINSVQLNVFAPGDHDVVAIRFYKAADGDFAHSNSIGVVNAIPGRTVARLTQQASGTTAYYWAAALDGSGNEGPTTGPIAATTYSLLDADFTPGLYPTRSYASLAAFPASTGSGRVAYSQADGKLYRDGTGGWTAQQSGFDITDGTFYGSKIVAGTVGVDELAAHAVTVSKLGVLGDSLFPDPQISDAAWWDANPTGISGGGGHRSPGTGGWYISRGGDNPTYAGGLNGWRLDASNAIGTGRAYLVAPTLSGIVAGQYYNVRMTLTNYNGDQYLQASLRWLDISGNAIGNDVMIKNAAPGFVGLVDLQVQAPGGAAYYVLYFFNQGGTNTTLNMVVGGITLRQAGTGRAIVDGTIVAAKVAGKQFTADQIATDSLTGDLFKSATSLPATLTIGNTGFSLGNAQAAAADGSPGANHISYTEYEIGTGGWVVGYDPASILTAFGANSYSGKRYIQGNFTAAGSYIGNTNQQVSIKVARFPVTAGDYAYFGSYIQNDNCAAVMIVRFVDGAGNYLGYSPSATQTNTTRFPSPGGDWENCLFGLFATAPTGAVTGEIEWYAHANAGGAGDITIAGARCMSVPVGTINPPAYSPGPAPDAAAVVNANTTTITPGKILIAGGTTLADWRSGGDQTKIEGGNIDVNSVRANSLYIGNRNINVANLDFSVDAAGTTLSWTGGAVLYMNDAGSQTGVFTAAGSVTGTGSNTYYVYWTQGATSLVATTDSGAGSDPNKIVFAVWRNGSKLIVANYGGTIVDGSRITTGSILANRLAVQQLSAITADIGVIRAGVLVAQSGLSELNLNQRYIIFNNGSVMKVTGEGFGTQNQFVDWFGPSMDPSQCSESNAITYARVDGSAYFGGALSAGTLTTKAGSSDTSAAAVAETPVFGSRGHAITVAVSYAYATRQMYTYPGTSAGLGDFNAAASANGAPTAGAGRDTTASGADPGSFSIDLYRSIGEAAYVKVATLSGTGNWLVEGTAPTPAAGESGPLTLTDNAGGSLTYTDPDQSAADRQFKAVMTARNPKYTANISQTISIVCVEQ